MIGQTISRYQILAKIGGSEDQGPIFKAMDTEKQRPVALRFLPPNIGDNPQSKKNFIEEATRVSALGHPNIAEIYEIGETPSDQIFIVCAYENGQTLEALFERGEQQDVDRVIAWGGQLASALKAAHQLGVVHRDVKPSSVFFTESGRLVLSDFGLAKVMGDGGMTLTGLTQGTPAYMAPEQLKGDEIDLRTDLWAAGVLLYEALAGERPFRGANVPAVVHAVYSLDPKPLSEYRDDLPSHLIRIVHRLLAKDPADRPGSAEALLYELGFEDDDPDTEQRTLPLYDFPDPSEMTAKLSDEELEALSAEEKKSAEVPAAKRFFAATIVAIFLMVLIGLFLTYLSVKP